MVTGILLINLILNSIVVNGQDACVISVNSGKEWAVNPPALAPCNDIAKDVMEKVGRTYPCAAVSLIINGHDLNRI